MQEPFNQAYFHFKHIILYNILIKKQNNVRLLNK